MRSRQSNFLSAFFNTIMSSRWKCENIWPFRDAGFDFDMKALQYQSDSEPWFEGAVHVYDLE